ncbi:MAG TPA: hypothetical protein VHY48_11770 [Acidobacteriaceae bacterium]|nr:hypothetical protein [Acidobacteriaceae bacterium]
MRIEQQPPQRPNFLLVVLLFAATIIVIFIGAYIVLHWNHHIVPKDFNKHPTAQLIVQPQSTAV